MIVYVRPVYAARRVMQSTSYDMNCSHMSYMVLFVAELVEDNARGCDASSKTLQVGLSEVNSIHIIITAKGSWYAATRGAVAGGEIYSLSTGANT